MRSSRLALLLLAGVLPASITCGVDSTRPRVPAAATAQNIAKWTDLPTAPVVGSSHAVTVKATDSLGNAVSGVAVTFAVTAGGGSVAPTTATTDASGLAGTSFTLGNPVDTNTATATAKGLAGSPVTFSTVSVAGPPNGIVNIGTDPVGVVAGATFSDSVRVQVRDRLNNPTPGVSVAFAVSAGGGNVTPAAVATDANGKAATRFVTGTTVGTNTATATVAGLTAITFSITTVAPTLIWSGVSGGTTQDLASVWGASASDVWAVGSGGTILHYDGASWSGVSSPTTQMLRGVWGTSASDVWVVGDSGTIIHYGGISWSSVSSGTTYKLWSVWGSSASDVWAVGDWGTILHYDGANWSSGPTRTYQSIYSVWGSSASDVWAVGSDVMGHYNGTSWSIGDPGPGLWFQAVWGTSPSDMWVVGIGYHEDVGMILHFSGYHTSQPGGASLGVPRNSFGVWGTSASDVWVVGANNGSGNSGTIVHYDGTTWSIASSGAFQQLRSVWGASSVDVWAVGLAGTIVHGSPAGSL